MFFWKTLKDKNLRFVWFSIESWYKILKLISLNKHLPTYLISKFFKFKCDIKNKCLFSNKSHGIIRRFKVSGIFLRQLGRIGFFFGLKKVSW